MTNVTVRRTLSPGHAVVWVNVNPGLVFSYCDPEIQCLNLNRLSSGVELALNSILKRDRKVTQQLYFFLKIF